MDENQDIITMEDEEGNVIKMRVIDLLKYQGEQYVLMQDAEQDKEHSYIFRFIDQQQNYDQLESIEDEQELAVILRLFKEKIRGQGHIN